MCNDDEFKRQIFKQGEGPATIPVSADHRNGDWLDTDIYETEWYQDILTGKVYTRNATGIVSADGSTISTQVVLDKAAVNGMNATPPVLLTAPAGYAVRFTKKPVLKTFSDGLNWTFSSSETVNVFNSSLGVSLMLQWGDPAVTTDGSYMGADFYSYDLVTGDVYVTSSIAIGGGGTNGTFTFYLDYELFLL